LFRYRRTGDLLRSLAILKVCSINLFVDNALPGRQYIPTVHIYEEEDMDGLLLAKFTYITYVQRSADETKRNAQR
jgi:hypothetical protein